MEQVFFNFPLSELESNFKRWFREAQSEMQSGQIAQNSEDYTQGYVFGLKGIRELFGVSHATAQHYKDTFLQPAVKQNGRKIVVDVAKALELFDQYNK